MRKVLWTIWALALAIPLYAVLFEKTQGVRLELGVLPLYLITMAVAAPPLLALFGTKDRRLVRMLFISTTLVFAQCLAIGVVTWINSRPVTPP
jgi:hypothetical protein